MPLTNLLFRSKKLRKAAENKMATQLADDPELLEEMAGEHLSKEQLKQFNQVMGQRTEGDRRQLIETIFEKANSGQQLNPQDLARSAPLTGDEARSKNKRKSKTRNKSKAARRQRKQQRKH